MVETIWEGDVKEWGRAFDLICIVDQIQDFAVHHHRPFVMKHLEAWHARHQKTKEPVKEAIRTANATTADMDIPDEDSAKVDSNPLDGGNTSLDPHADLDMKDSVLIDEELAYLNSTTPAWWRLKSATEFIRRDMSNETRRRNRSLREAARASEAAKEAEKEAAKEAAEEAAKEAAEETAKETDTTPARGRPPTYKVTKARKPPKQGRPRGRPPKANVTSKRNTST